MTLSELKEKIDALCEIECYRARNIVVSVGVGNLDYVAELISVDHSILTDDGRCFPNDDPDDELDGEPVFELSGFQPEE